VEAIQKHLEWCSYDDRRVLALARDESRAIVTDNLVDMRPLRYEAIAPGGPGDHGMIFIPAATPACGPTSVGSSQRWSRS
jgi:hypothetical protein